MAQPVKNAKVKDLKAAVMITPLVSLVKSVMGPGYGFALIEEDGSVRFHSDSNLNQRQNFFREFDKDRVLRESFRVLRPGGRLAVSDVVTRGEVDAQIRQNILLWVGCVAGALEEGEYREKLVSAGFEQVEIEPTRVYRVEDAREFLSEKGLDVDAMAAQVDGKFMSAFVRARKSKSAKTTGACCAPACCN